MELFKYFIFNIAVTVACVALIYAPAVFFVRSSNKELAGGLSIGVGTVISALILLKIKGQ